MNNNLKPKIFKKRQTVWLDKEGIILNTDDIFLKLKPYFGKCVIPILPFIECVFPEILKALQKETSIHFPGINLSGTLLSKSSSDRFFDFYFFKDSKNRIKWEIFDLSSYYQSLRMTQHFFQVLELNSQKKSRQFY